MNNRQMEGSRLGSSEEDGQVLVKTAHIVTTKQQQCFLHRKSGVATQILYIIYVVSFREKQIKYNTVQ